MKLTPIVFGATVGAARDLRDTMGPEGFLGGKMYPYYAAGEAILGLGAAYYLREPYDNLGLAAVAFGFKDLTWIAQHWPCCGY